jgi:hypothetical protein
VLDDADIYEGGDLAGKIMLKTEKTISIIDDTVEFSLSGDCSLDNRLKTLAMVKASLSSGIFPNHEKEFHAWIEKLSGGGDKEVDGLVESMEVLEVETVGTRFLDLFNGMKTEE